MAVVVVVVRGVGGMHVCMCVCLHACMGEVECVYESVWGGACMCVGGGGRKRGEVWFPAHQ